MEASAAPPGPERARATRGQSDGPAHGEERRGPLQRLVRAVDNFQSRRPPLAVPVAVVKKFGEDRAGNLAGLIAYYAFFSLFPLLLVLVTVLGFVLADDAELRRDVLDSALAQFPVLGDQLRDNTGQLEGSTFALVVGVVSALWAGTGVMKAAQDAMNDVWDVPLRQRTEFAVSTSTVEPSGSSGPPRPVVAVAESLTGGLLCSRFARREGASTWFRGVVVAYARMTKERLLDIGDAPVVSEAAAQEHLGHDTG